MALFTLAKPLVRRLYGPPLKWSFPRFLEQSRDDCYQSNVVITDFAYKTFCFILCGKVGIDIFNYMGKQLFY
jgi:hypothetical protein